jgi:hypothetical protein
VTIHHGKDSPEEIRQKRIDFHMNYCVNYKPHGVPIGGEYCGLKCGATTGHKKPCIGGHKLEAPLSLCDKWERRSLESAIERHERIEESFRRMEKVGPAVAAWRAKPPKGKQEVIECPACGGRLHLSQSAYNGHVHGKCETEGCVSWME